MQSPDPDPEPNYTPLPPRPKSFYVGQVVRFMGILYYVKALPTFYSPFTYIQKCSDPYSSWVIIVNPAQQLKAFFPKIRFKWLQGSIAYKGEFVNNKNWLDPGDDGNFTIRYLKPSNGMSEWVTVNVKPDDFVANSRPYEWVTVNVKPDEI